jgi:hypothetical protein
LKLVALIREGDLEQILPSLIFSLREMSKPCDIHFSRGWKLRLNLTAYVGKYRSYRVKKVSEKKLGVDIFANISAKSKTNSKIVLDDNH